MPFFSSNEMTRRVRGLREGMKERGLDCVMSWSFHSNYYLSGFFMVPWGRFSVVIIPIENDGTLITPKIEEERAKEQTWIGDIRSYADEEKPPIAVTRKIKDFVSERILMKARIGIEEDSIPVPLFKILRRELPEVEFIDVSDVLDSLRVVKSDEEINLIRIASEMANVGAVAFVEAIKEGRPELEISSRCELAMEKELARQAPNLESYGTISICASGTRSLLGHIFSSGKKIRRGELINLNTLGVAQGYYVSLERSIFFGKLPDHVRKPFEVMIDAFRQGMEIAGPGVKCSEIDILTRSIYEKAGFLQYVTHGTGHSCGVLGPFWGREEKGELRMYNHTVLEPGMVVTVEPSISIPGIGCFRHCDVILITKDGREVLTKFDKGAITIP